MLFLVLAQFKCAKPNSIVCFSNEQITYKYGYFNKNLYFAKHNNCEICYKNILNLTLNFSGLLIDINNTLILALPWDVRDVPNFKFQLLNIHQYRRRYPAIPSFAFHLSALFSHQCAHLLCVLCSNYFSARQFNATFPISMSTCTSK